MQPSDLKPRSRQVGSWERIQRWLVAAALAVPTLVLVWQALALEPTLPALTQADGAKAEALHSLIEAVGPGEPVRIAFEYGPAEADELNAIARPILMHLLERDAHIVVVSTRAEGLAMAESLQADIVSEGQYTITYQSATYLPGGATGIAQALSTTDVQPRLQIVLTSQANPLRWWIEQTQVRRQMENEELHLVAGISAGLEPVASPYLDQRTRQLEGIISGLSGAAAYEARRGTVGQATQMLNALAAGHVAMIAIMLVGALIFVFGRRPGREA